MVINCDLCDINDPFLHLRFIVIIIIVTTITYYICNFITFVSAINIFNVTIKVHHATFQNLGE